MGEIFIWWLVAEALGVAALPLATLVFAQLPDRGWALSKPLGLLVAGWLIWFPLSLVPALPYSRTWIAATYLLFAGGNAALIYRRVDLREALRGVLTRSRAYIIACETLFAGAFTLMAWERSFTPEVRNYEKFMDVAFLSGIWRAPHLPPPDPWLAPFTINYYYFGHFLMATQAKLLGIQPAVAFNLSIPLIFALVSVAVFGVSANIVAVARRSPALTRAIPFGLASVLLVLVLGNLSGAQVWWQQATNLARLHPSLLSSPWAWWQHRDLWLGYDWWSPSRVVPNTITEFPAFSFILADLHAHVLALPFAALAVGIGWNLLLARGTALRAFGSGRSGILAMLTAAVCLGSLYAINSTDLPTYLGLALLALGIQQWLAHGRRFDQPFLLDLFIAAALLTGGSLLAYLPFYRSFVSPSLGIATVLAADRTPLGYEIAMFGLPLFIVASLLAMWLARALHTERALGVHTGRVALVAGGTAILLIWTIATMSNAAWTLIWSTVFVAVCGWLAWRRLAQAGSDRGEAAGTPAVRAEVWMLCLVGTAVALIAVCELIYVRDLFSSRMNTVFKLYYQAWLLLGIAGGPALAWLFASLRASLGSALAAPLAFARHTPTPLPASPPLAFAGVARLRLNMSVRSDQNGRIGNATPRAASGSGEAPASIDAAKGIHANEVAAQDGSRRVVLPDLPSVLRWFSVGGMLVWSASLAALVLAALVYPVLGSSVWTQNFSLPHGLDGTAYMATDDTNRPAECGAFQGTNRGDGPAITWLNTHVEGVAVIAEAPGCDWSYYSRISAFTGLQTLVGWGNGGHEGWWRANWPLTRGRPDLYDQRADVLKQIYTSPDRATVLALLRQYHVRYVYVGFAERELYVGANLQRFDAFLHRVYNQGGVAIYEAPEGVS